MKFATPATLVASVGFALLAGCSGGGGASQALPQVSNNTVPGASDVRATTTPGTPPPATTATAGSVSVVQQATAGTNGLASSLTVTLSTPTRVGDLVVAFVGVGDTSDTITPPDGWTAATDAAGHACSQMTSAAGSQGEKVFTRRVAAAQQSYTFKNNHSDTTAIGVVELTNAASISACGGAEPAKNSSSGSVAAAALKPATSGELPVVGYAPSTSGMTDTPRSGWTSTLYNNKQTPWMTLDVEVGPSTTLDTVAPTTTFGNLGGSNIVYAPSVALLVTSGGSGGSGGPAPVSTPTTAPTAAPTAVPAPPQPSQPCCTNGTAWPTAFQPYSPTSIWNHKLPASPVVYASSAQRIADAFANGCGGNSMCGAGFRYVQWGGGQEYDHPVVFASSTDPLVNAWCDEPGYWTTGTAGCHQTPTQIRIPAKARPASGGDHHLAVVQPDGTEYDFWQVNKNSRNTANYGSTTATTDWQRGDEIDFWGGGLCGNFYSGSGITPNNATSGGNCLAAGTITSQEIVNNQINHALTAAVGCSDPQVVYPAVTGTHTCPSSWGAVIPMGALIHVKDTDAQINAMSISAFEKAVLRAYHDYGLYVMDGANQLSNGDGIPHAPWVGDPGGQYTPFGVTNPMPNVLQNAGWQPDQVPNNCSQWPLASCGGSQTEYRLYGNSGWNPFPDGWKNHLEILDPCNARQTC